MRVVYKAMSEIAASEEKSVKSLYALCAREGITKTEEGWPEAEVLRAIQEAKKRDNRAPLEEGDPRRRKIELENRLLEIKIAESEGALVDAEQVEQEAQRIGAAIKNDLLALPQSMAGRLAGQTEPAKIAEILETALRDCLRHLADEVNK